jgi:hypothetical protein
MGNKDILDYVKSRDKRQTVIFHRRDIEVAMEGDRYSKFAYL